MSRIGGSDEERGQRLRDAIQYNLEHTVRFKVEGVELTRRLVDQVQDTAGELSVGSPVGRALRNARPGDRMRVEIEGKSAVDIAGLAQAFLSQQS